MINTLNQKEYHLYFQKLGELICKWYEKYPYSKDISNAMRCTAEIGNFTTSLICERDLLKIRLDKSNDQRRKLILENKELKEQIKKYEI